MSPRLLALAVAIALAVPAAWILVARRRTRSRIDVVLLDWGDTLMVDDRTQDGPMASWPRVAAVPGARETLSRLRSHYRLIVATNADQSSGPDVRAALARVGLDEFIDEVVSSRDVGARKPDGAFFRAALGRAGEDGGPVSPARAVMVGDSLTNDVGGAKAAGMRAVLLDASRGPLPPDVPRPDAVIAQLDELPGALARLAAGRGLLQQGGGRGQAAYGLVPAQRPQ